VGILSGWWRDYKQAFGKQYSGVAQELTAFNNVRHALATTAAITQDTSKPFWASVNKCVR
jgi:hypothetical protein